MQKHLCKTKACAWINAGKLVWRPDRFTNDTKLSVRECRRPADWAQIGDVADNTMVADTSNGAKREYVESMESVVDSIMRNESKSTDDGVAPGSAAIVKEEPADEGLEATQKMDDYVNECLADPWGCASGNAGPGVRDEQADRDIANDGVRVRV